MSKHELIAKCDAAIAACLDQVLARAQGQEANNAKAFAEAARIVETTRHEITTHTEEESD